MSAVTLTKGSYSIVIDATKVEEDIQNKISKVPIPMTKSRLQSGQSPTTKIISLKRVIHTYSISGFIRAQGSYTATEAKNVLIDNILFSAGTIYLNWRDDTNIPVEFEKAKFIDIATRAEKPSASGVGEPIAYEVELLLTRGELI